ncbi:MAG: MtrB/PioB family decaheme-associated outer membrane protein [Syntrophales bacterium]
MKKWIISSMLIFSMASFSMALADDDKLSGEVSATGTLTSVVGNKAKFNEYRDVRDGVYGDVKLKYESERSYVDLNAKDMGYDTQQYSIRGGMWGDFKFDLNYDELPHNITYDAKTFYSGAGSSNLTYPTQPPSTNTNTWNTFDYSTKRKNLSGGFQIDTLKPFFFDVSASSEQKNGTYPLGAAGTSPGGIDIELPAPIDYRTDSVNVAAGYIQNPLRLSLGYMYSSFSNSNANLNFRNPSTANTASATDTFTLPPDNYNYKINMLGSLRLPFNSKIDMKLAAGSSKSDATLLTSYVADVPGGLTNIGLNKSTFNGQVDTRNLAMSLTSKPLSFLDGRLFIKYDETENKSDQITTTDLTQSPSTFTNALFDYRKVIMGAEFGFRLPEKFYLNTNYSYGTISRKRDDIPENRDYTYGAELKWTGLDLMAARIGYERLDRKAEFEAPDVPSIETYIRRFDAAAKYQDTYKASLDFFPLENLNFSLSYRYRETNYPDTILGLTGEKHDEFAVDADYLIAKWIRLFAFFDYERIRQYQFQRQTTNAFDPSLPPTTTNFNWTANQKDESYSYTVGTDIFIIKDKLTLRLQHSYLESNGSVDYTYLLGGNPLPVGRTQDNIDLSNLDDYKLRYYLIKLTYNVNKASSVAVGYAYEKYIYSDAQYDGYQYVPATSGTNGGYLTGAYSDPSYESHIVFLNASYRF